MLKVGAIAFTAFIGLAIAYLINQLSPLGDFPGRNVLIGRLLLWLTLIVIVPQRLGLALPHAVVVGLWCVGAVAVIWLISDVSKLVKASRQVSQQQVTASNLVREEADELRKKLIVEVRRRVRQRLDYAFGEQALINIPMEPQPQAVEGSRRQRTVYLVPQPVQHLETFNVGGLRAVPSKETILETFEDEDISGQLLILGAPGSGKTTALLKLAEDLLVRAYSTQDIPYIFELSTWSDAEKDIESWMIAQLEFDYGISQAVSRHWIENGYLLPLLDGLDELSMTAQQKCMEKINEYVCSALGRQIVICCRLEEYYNSRIKLDSLNGTLCLQPLTDDQIQKYYEAIDRLDIWEGLQDKEGLGALFISSGPDWSDLAPIRIPFFLQILTIAYSADRKISTKSELFEAYIERQLSLPVRRWDRRLARKRTMNEANWAYRAVENEPSVKVVREYLIWLSKKLNENNSANNFLIEQIQPSWLSTNISKNIHQFVVCVVITGMLAMYGILLDLDVVFASSVLGFLPYFKRIYPSQSIEPVEILYFSGFQRSWRLLLKLYGRSLIGMISSVFFIVLILFPIASLLYPLVGMSTTDLPTQLAYAASLGFVIGWVLLLILFLKRRFQVRDIPNQGIFASAKNSVIITTIMYPAGVIIFCITAILLTDSNDSEVVFSFPDVLSGGLACAIIIGIFMGGGLAAIQHVVLRVLLVLEGATPWNYAQFLRYTTERRLTQQIGGRFRFIHRELLDHFDPTRVSDVTADSR